MLNKVRGLFTKPREDRVQIQLEELRKRIPVPVFWLYGKTQSGKTSLIKYLTKATEAEIGQGFRPCTRYSRLYEFPAHETPLLTFLDTRGMDEPGYDPGEDLNGFSAQAHLVLVTVKVMDHAQENVIKHLRTIRNAQPRRPVVLALTCLHEAYPQQQHPQPYPFTRLQARTGNWTPPPEFTPDRLPALHAQLEPLSRSMAEQCRRFGDLVDVVVPIDLTQPEEGFEDPNYGGEHLKHVLLEQLPSAYRQTLLALDEITQQFRDLHFRQALPTIIGYSTLAATAGAIPIPWLDLLILPSIQSRMIYSLARLYGQPLTATRFMELATSLGMGIFARQAVRELVKFIPYVGAVAGAVLAGASTFALGKAFCHYYTSVHKGHVPQADELRHYYKDQLSQAQKAWGKIQERE